MTRPLPAGPHLPVFLAAAFILAVTPGPGVLYIVTRSLMLGRRHGLASVLGVAIGNLGNVAGASVGLAALFAVSASAFTLVKLGGALYLIHLGLRTLRAPAGVAQHAAVPAGAHAAAPVRVERTVCEGFIVALLNPKTTLFFAAFLPQFMRADVAPVPQSLVLGAIFVAIAAVTDSGYALAAGLTAHRLERADGVRVVGRVVAGGTLIGLGVAAALAGGTLGKTGVHGR